MCMCSYVLLCVCIRMSYVLLCVRMCLLCVCVVIDGVGGGLDVLVRGCCPVGLTSISLTTVIYLLAYCPPDCCCDRHLINGSILPSCCQSDYPPDCCCDRHFADGGILAADAAQHRRGSHLHPSGGPVHHACVRWNRGQRPRHRLH